MREDPRGHYVYAYLDGDTPFYIGKGIGDRAWKHLTPSVRLNSSTYFYYELNNMTREGREPEILILRDGLTEELAYKVESDLILLVGRRCKGTGTLCNTAPGNSDGRSFEHGVQNSSGVKAWGLWFSSVNDVARDDRCVVVASTIVARMLNGETIEEAAEAPPQSPGACTCWDEDFVNLAAVGRDDRCVVSITTFRARLKEPGWTIEDAAGTPTPKSTVNLHPCTCWNEGFDNRAEVSYDKRCHIPYTTLVSRMAGGMTLEEAANSLPRGKRKPRRRGDSI